jgi:hypothetical protein
MLATRIYGIITGEISPMVYVMMFISVLIGFFFLTGYVVNPADSFLYDLGVFIPRALWGGWLFTTALIAEYGFLRKNDSAVAFGGIGGFLAWMFACISLAMGGVWYIFLTVGLFHLIFHVYVVLASSLGLIRREAIIKKQARP